MQQAESNSKITQLTKDLANAKTEKDFKESHDDLESKLAQLEIEKMNFEMLADKAQGDLKQVQANHS